MKYQRFTLGSVNSKRIETFSFFLNTHTATVGPCLIKRRPQTVVYFIKKYMSIYHCLCAYIRKNKHGLPYTQLSLPILFYWVDDYCLETDLRHRIPARYQPFSNNVHVCKVYSDWLITSCARHSKSCARHSNSCARHSNSCARLNYLGTEVTCVCFYLSIHRYKYNIHMSPLCHRKLYMRHKVDVQSIETKLNTTWFDFAVFVHVNLLI